MATKTKFKYRARIMRAVKGLGYQGDESLTDIEKFFEEKDFDAQFDFDGKAIDLRDAWKKTVIVTATAGEDVQLRDSEMEDGEDLEGAAGDMPDDPDEAKLEKSSGPQSRKRPNMADWARANGGPASDQFGKPMGPNVAAEKRYDRAVARKTKNAQTRMLPVFESGEEAGRNGAWFRLAIAGDKNYDAKAMDIEIVGKDLSGAVNNLGGALVPTELSSRIIDLTGNFGAVRRAVGVQRMTTAQMRVPRKTSYATFTAEGENNAATAQDNPTSDAVDLNAVEATALVHVPISLIHDSAVDIADMIAVSFAKGRAQYEDSRFLLGTGYMAGSSIKDKITAGGNNEYDAALSAWTDFDSDDWTSLKGLVPGVAWTEGEPALICSANWYHTNIHSLAWSAGGRLTSDVFNGVGPDGVHPNARADGHPVYFTDSSPTSYLPDQQSAWFGAFDAGCKMGEVEGDMAIDSSEHFRFDRNQISFRARTRLAFVAHDVNNTVNGSMIVAFRD